MLKRPYQAPTLPHLAYFRITALRVGAASLGQAGHQSPLNGVKTRVRQLPPPCSPGGGLVSKGSPVSTAGEGEVNLTSPRPAAASKAPERTGQLRHRARLLPVGSTASPSHGQCAE